MAVSWRTDQAILERMERVAALDVRKRTLREIAREVGVSHVQVLRDLEHIAQLRREALTAGELEDRRQRSLAVHHERKPEAFARLAALPAEARNAPEYLSQIGDAEKEIARLEGTAAPTKVAPTDPSGEHAYADLADGDIARGIAALLDAARARAAGGADGGGPLPLGPDRPA